MPLALMDRDGVINENRADYVTRWEEFRFLPGALDGLTALQRLGLRLAVVTNQSAVGRGLLSARTLEEIHRRMLAHCDVQGVTIEGIFVCPHAPWEGCDCRKPRPGLLWEAMAALGEPPERCVAIGDGHEDLLAARAAAVPFVLVRSGRGEETLRHRAFREYPPLFVAQDLWAAALALGAHIGERLLARAS